MVGTAGYGAEVRWLAALLAMAILATLLGRGRVLESGADAAQQAVPVGRPNILFLVADDLGYNDTSAMGATGVDTPNLLDLARAGVRFTRHYADATCSPSRVAMLTGRYAERSGFRHAGMEIPPEFVTLPEALRAAGYRTHLVGKWHAGEERRESLPLAQGFDTFFGFHNQWELRGALDLYREGHRRPTYFDPWLREGEGDPEPHDGHLTDLLAQRTVQLIHAAGGASTPWFVYHGFLAPHAPIQPAKRFRSRYPDTPEGHYLALLAQLDEAVGKLLAALEESGQADNTLVVFVSDNGGTNLERDNNYPWHGRKNETFEGAFRTPLLLHWPRHLPAGRSIDNVVMNVDLYPTLLQLAGLPEMPAGALDGISLVPLLAGEPMPAARERSWEQYQWNIDALTYSYLSDDGRWRLANVFGLPPQLFDLQAEPAGAHDVADRHPGVVATLRARYRESHWRNALLHPVVEQDGDTRAYSGLDLMRTPFNYGFAIGLEIGPLDGGGDGRAQLLAEQGNAWSLTWDGGTELALQLGEQTLHAAGFDPQRCNSIVITGNYQPPALVEPVPGDYRVKLYLQGRFADIRSGMPAARPAAADIAAPTRIHHGGRAVFANLMLSSAGEGYYPTWLPDEHRGLFVEMREKDALERPRLEQMEALLCRG
jgi:arylsulfatase A-like enzyme